MRFSVLIKIALLLLGASCTFARRRRPHARASARSPLRVYKGYNDTDRKYPYVVSLVTKGGRACTGTLVTQNWVLTAGHCAIQNVIEIQYGNMTLHPTESNTKRDIIKFIRPTQFVMRLYTLKHDIALARVDAVMLGVYGSISSVDYRTLIGFRAEYAGYGSTCVRCTPEQSILDHSRPLQLGEAVVRPCPEKNWKHYGPFICLSRRCGKIYQMVLGGDSGGPLVNDGKIVGVLSGYSKEKHMTYTPVSPYLEWIQKTMNNYDDDH